MALDQILPHLNKVKASGQKYWACCPVHNEDTPSLQMQDLDNGYVLMHCFGCGAKAHEVVQALGLSTSTIFPPDDEYVRPQVTRKQREQNEVDQWTVRIFEATQKQGGHLTLHDKRAYREAQCRIRGFQELQNK